MRRYFFYILMFLITDLSLHGVALSIAEPTPPYISWWQQPYDYSISSYIMYGLGNFYLLVFWAFCLMDCLTETLPNKDVVYKWLQQFVVMSLLLMLFMRLDHNATVEFKMAQVSASFILGICYKAWRKSIEADRWMEQIIIAERNKGYSHVFFSQYNNFSTGISVPFLSMSDSFCRVRIWQNCGKHVNELHFTDIECVSLFTEEIIDGQQTLIRVQLRNMEPCLFHLNFGSDRYKAESTIAKINSILQTRQLPTNSLNKGQDMTTNYDYDFFISHASEDKNSFVRELANELMSKGASVWYDEFSLSVGDSLRQSIDKGLSQSRFGVIVLSPYFFEKSWTNYELNALNVKSITIAKEKVILPIWHNVSSTDITSYSLNLADKVALNSANHSIREIASQLIMVTRE